MSGHILAMGGGALLDPASKLEGLLLELSGKPRPRICFLPTAVADSAEAIERFYDAFRDRACEPSHLTLFGTPDDPAAKVFEQDVIYVHGGNTANMLALWRVHRIDLALRQAWEEGAVLGGWSAGANCWFEDSVTDSYGPELRPLGGGLRLLHGSFCPHYDAEPERRPTYTRLVREGVLPLGFAADDDAALVFEGTKFTEVVSQREGARGWCVTGAGDEPLEPRLL
jgi:peptidase E